MAEIKHTAKTAESSGVQNVGFGATASDTAIEFQEVRAKRLADEKAGKPRWDVNGAYSDPNASSEEPKPSKRTEKEMERGAKAQGDKAQGDKAARTKEQEVEEVIAASRKK